MNIQLILHNAGPSLRGLCRYAAAHPRHAVALFVIRVVYALTGRVLRPWTDPFGFVADTPGTIVCYWSIFVARLLDHPSWVQHVMTTASPRVIDVGANAGVFTHRILTMNPAASVLAIEPQEELAARIREYAAMRACKVEVISAACSDYEGSSPLFREFAGDVGASLVADYFEQHRSLSRDNLPASVVIRVHPLDRLVPSDTGPIDLLKIDAEGNDVRVLAGAAEVLRRTHYVLAELRSDADMREALELLGERWTAVRLGLHDCLFVNTRPILASSAASDRR